MERMLLVNRNQAEPFKLLNSHLKLANVAFGILLKLVSAGFGTLHLYLGVVEKVRRLQDGCQVGAWMIKYMHGFSKGFDMLRRQGSQEDR